MKTKNISNLTVNKFSPYCKGPYSVSKINENLITYLITCLKTNQVIRAHHSDLFIYKCPPLYIASHPYFSELNFDANAGLQGKENEYQGIVWDSSTEEDSV
jgi:hypothetical protein